VNHLSTQPGKSWNAATELRKKQIIWLLDGGDKSFSELHRKLRSGKHGWARATLTICLREMQYKEHSIKKEKKKPKGKREVYSLVKDHPQVAERLNWNLHIDPNLQQQLDEEGFIASWLNSLKFAFVALLNDLTILGQWRDEKKLEDQMQSDIENFVEFLNFNGNILVERIRLGTLKPEKLREIQREMLAEVKKQWSIDRKPKKKRKTKT
jgi:DNA-binding HxlR family transcriptional regulator